MLRAGKSKEEITNTGLKNILRPETLYLTRYLNLLDKSTNSKTKSILLPRESMLLQLRNMTKKSEETKNKLNMMRD